MIDSRITETIKKLIEWLVSQDYEAIAEYTGGIRLSSQLISDAIMDYGHKLTFPPEEVFENIDVIEVIGEKPRKWSVVFDLWTEDEGQSDLSIECTLIDADNHLLNVELDNLHVR